MSVGLKIICFDCKVGVYFGTMNSMVDEEPEKVGKFIWKHKEHKLGTITDSGIFQDSFYMGWVEE